MKSFLSLLTALLLYIPAFGQGGLKAKAADKPSVELRIEAFIPQGIVTNKSSIEAASPGYTVSGRYGGLADLLVLYRPTPGGRFFVGTGAGLWLHGYTAHLTIQQPGVQVSMLTRQKFGSLIIPLRVGTKFRNGLEAGGGVTLIGNFATSTATRGEVSQTGAGFTAVQSGVGVTTNGQEAYASAAADVQVSYPFGPRWSVSARGLCDLKPYPQPEGQIQLVANGAQTIGPALAGRPHLLYLAFGAGFRLY